MIERQHLRILQQVHTKGSLTAAAQELCLTQSALSHSIRKLEGSLGTPLWTVSGRVITLTQAGEHLLRLSDRILPEFERAEEQMQAFADGRKGVLTIGMECHPCYQWLLKVISPYLKQWPDVELDVRQQFQFGGLAALFRREIDLLVTPDPVNKSGVTFHNVFDYELMLAVSLTHPFSKKSYITPEDLQHEVLLSYPVEPSRLDIYTQFLLPKECRPRQHRNIESTDIMLEMVAAGRGVAAMPSWFIQEYSDKIPLNSIRLGRNGIFKSLHLGIRNGDAPTYLRAFIDLARAV